ncbi:MAG: acyltransferase family protein [Telluria sp.]|nr:acyltransferase family protein [Telluria sp.]
MRIDKDPVISGPAPSVRIVPRSDHPVYRPDIDGLRALAVLSVVAFHAFPDLIAGGFVGVDIFFVISGFLISSIIMQGLAQGTFSFGTFYARRIRRIFPALVLVLAACSLFGWFALFPDEFKQLGKHMLGGAGFVSNFVLFNEVGYFDTAAATKPLLHLWSLGIEEQFYIAWPVLLLLAWKWRLNLLAVSAVLTLLSFVLNVAGLAHWPNATFYLPASRVWELWIGATLAAFLLKPPAPGAAQLPRALLAWSGLGLIALALVLVTKDASFPGWPALLPTCGAAFLIAAGPGAWPNRVLLSNRVMVWFGLISYPLYLWHWPLLSFAQIVESGLPRPAIRAGAVLLAIALAWLTYRLLERPLRRVSRARWPVALLVALMLAVAAGGAYVWRNAGLPLRPGIVENQHNNKALVLVEDGDKAAACKLRYGFTTPYQYCLLDKVDAPPTVALIGDSHGYHVVAGLTRHYREQGDNLLFLGTRHPFWGLPAAADDEYQKVTQPMLELALATPTITTVVISTAVKLHSGWPALTAAMRDTFKRFTEAGKHVIFMNDIAWLDFDPRACIKRAGVISSNTKVPCAVARATFDKAGAEHDAMLAVVLREFPTVELFSPAMQLCDQQFCWGMKDGRLMYRDTNHLSYEGDLFIGAAFSAWQRAQHPQAAEKPLK